MSTPKRWTWFEGDWHEGELLLAGPHTHAFWLGSSVFDGARAFEGVAPDLDLHCQRVNASALALGLQPTKRWEELVELTQDGLARFDKDAATYIRPMYWAEQGGFFAVAPEPSSTNFCLHIHESPMPDPNGFSVTLSPFRRPSIETMPTNAKAGCLYPNNARALTDARNRGFDNAVVLDMLGNVAELATANVFMVKDGIVHTPAENGTFLAGITRRRAIELLRSAGQVVHERSIVYRDFLDADEIFLTGNYAKVVPIIRIEDRSLQPGPVAERARQLYWEFAHG